MRGVVTRRMRWLFSGRRGRLGGTAVWFGGRGLRRLARGFGGGLGLVGRRHRRSAHEGLRRGLGRRVARGSFTGERGAHGSDRRRADGRVRAARRRRGHAGRGRALGALHLGERCHVRGVARGERVDETLRGVCVERRLLRASGRIDEVVRRAQRAALGHFGAGALRGAFGRHRRDGAIGLTVGRGERASHRRNRERTEKKERRSRRHGEDRRERLRSQRELVLRVGSGGTGILEGAGAFLHGGRSSDGKALPCASG